MGYITIENFAGGMDRRRPIYALPPGVLWECKNAHLTEGGDIEKRKAFIDIGSFPSGTFGLADLNSRLYTFGSAGTPSSLPPFVTYMRLQHPAGFPMQSIESVEHFDGKLYVVALFVDGQYLHFYDGVLVPAWTDGIARPEHQNIEGIAEHMRALIDADAAYVATRAGTVVTVTAAVPGTAFTPTAEVVGSGGSVAVATTTDNVAGVDAANASFAFNVTGGDGTGTVTSVKIGGVEVLVNTVTWGTSNTATASGIAAEIASHVGTTGWTAAASGQQVTITKNASGAAHNQLTVEVVTTNTLRVNNLEAGTHVLGTTAGGVDAVAAVAQVSTITFGGAFVQGDRYSVLLSGTVFGNKFKPFVRGLYVKTHRNKLYSPNGATINFSGVNTAIGWSSEENPGAGFLNVSNHDSGSQVSVALETFFGNLAVLAENNAQIWSMNADDSLNTPVQFLNGVGTIARRSLLEFAGVDTMFLHHSGIRSLRPRQATDSAFLNDAGSPIDAVVRPYLRTLSSAVQGSAVSVIDPGEGRFWMAVGERIYVLSHYPQAKVMAWSYYSLTFRPTWFAKIGHQVYVRGDDDKLYLYGGASGEEYDACGVDAQLPFILAKKEGTPKTWKGVDIAASGVWNVTALVDPRNTARYVDFGTIDGYSYLDGLAAVGVTSPAFAPRLQNTDSSAASLSHVTAYFDGASPRA